MAKTRSPQLRRTLQDQILQTWEAAVPTADNDWFKTSTVLAAAATTLAAASMTKSYAPGIPIVPVLVVTNAWTTGEDDWSGVSFQVTGVDQFGRKVTETVAATLSSHVWTAAANRAYATLISITFTITQGTGEAPDGSDEYVLGFAKTYGIGCRIAASADVLIHNFDGATDAGTPSTVYHTYVVAGTPNGAKLLRLYSRSSAI